jgi:hypothetical protein
VQALRSGQPDSRVRDGQRDIRDEIAYDHEDRADERVRQQHRVVGFAQAFEEQQAQALEVE